MEPPHDERRPKSGTHISDGVLYTPWRAWEPCLVRGEAAWAVGHHRPGVCPVPDARARARASNHGPTVWAGTRAGAAGPVLDLDAASAGTRCSGRYSRTHLSRGSPHVTPPA